MEKISFVILKAFLFSLVSLLMTFYSTAIFAKTDSPLSILPNHCHFTSNIKQTKNVEGLPVPLISSGQIFFHCKHGLIWQTIEPVKELLIFSGKYYQFKENGPNSLERLNTQESSFLSNLLQGIMGADQSYIEESFSIQKISSTSFKLIPKNTILQNVITHISIDVLPGQDLLIDILQSDNTLNSIQAFSSVILNESINNEEVCIKNTLPEIACKALFNPQLAANTLVK